MKKKNFLLFKYLIFLLLILSSGSLIAQIDTNFYQTEEIMITGTRTEKKIIDIPYPVSRIEQSSWQSTRKQAMNEILGYVPGLFFQPRYGNHDVRISIRGFGSRSNSGIRGVRILLDGIPESEPDGQTRVEALDFSAIGKIEVVRGNSSSLYTNAPGGVINFFSDINFPKTFVLTDNEFGSYDLRKNGVKVGYASDNAKFMFTSSYENYGGFREHSSEFQTRVNSVYEGQLSNKSTLSIYAYYVNGLIRLPGSQNLTQYNLDETKSDSTSIALDYRRITKKGRIGIKFNTKFGKDNNNMIEVLGYATNKDLTRADSRYRIYTRSGLGGSFRYVNQTEIASRNNEFSIGGDMYYQGGPMEFYTNVKGAKGDIIKALTDETVSNIGFYFTEQFPIVSNKFDILITGRYDRVNYDSKDNQNSIADTSRLFDKFTPKFALNYKFTPNMAVYTSFGLGFDTPANNELSNYPTSSNNGKTTLNPDLLPQNSTNFEIGFKGDLPPAGRSFLRNTFAELTLFSTQVKNEIVPFVVDGTYYYRNAAETQRNGLEAGFNTEITRGLTLRAAYTYSDFTYKDYKALVIKTTPVITQTVTDYSNNIVPTIPKHLFNSELGYNYNFSKYYTVFAKINFNYVDGMQVNDANIDSLKTAAYGLIGGQIGININYKGLSIIAYGGVNNIGDKKYVSFININDSQGLFYEAGLRRNFFGGLTIGYQFLK
ncbi:MAG: TonB-dependent receptor [Ignavibacteriae bacterium]|nr:TonB-dependent receptor [Ignavibacteriota bacterium]